MRVVVVLHVNVGDLVEDWRQTLQPFMRTCHYC